MELFLRAIQMQESARKRRRRPNNIYVTKLLVRRFTEHSTTVRTCFFFCKPGPAKLVLRPVHFLGRAMERLILSEEMMSGFSVRDDEPTLSFNPDDETKAVLEVDLGGEDGRHLERSGASGVAQVPKVLLAEREMTGCGGETDETRTKDELAEEDWLEAAHALFDTVANP